MRVHVHEHMFTHTQIWIESRSDYHTKIIIQYEWIQLSTISGLHAFGKIQITLYAWYIMKYKDVRRPHLRSDLTAGKCLANTCEYMDRSMKFWWSKWWLIFYHWGNFGNRTPRCLVLVQIITHGSFFIWDFSFWFLIFDICGLRSRHLSPVWYLLHLLIALSFRNWWYKEYDKNYKGPVFDENKTLGMSNLTISYNFQSIWLALLIDLVMQKNVTKIGVPYTWIWTFYLVPMNSAYRLP